MPIDNIAYLKREGVTRDGQDARMFDATSESADTKGFAERCEDPASERVTKIDFDPRRSIVATEK